MESYVVKKGLRMVLIKKMWAGEAPKVPAKIHILAGFHWFSLLFRPLDLHGRGFQVPRGSGPLPHTIWGWKKAKKVIKNLNIGLEKLPKCLQKVTY